MTDVIAILGGGAMGGMVGARLAAAGQDVLIVDVSRDLVDAIERHGISLESGMGALHARPSVTTDPAARDPVRAVFILVKSQHTASAARLASPLVGRDTTLVTLQNGWGNADVIADVYPADQLVIGVTYNSATTIAPGQIHQTGAGPTVVGPYLDGAELTRANAIGDLLREAGLEVTVTPEIKTEIWRKLILNAATLPTAALTGLRAADLGHSREALDLVDALAAEAVEAARSQGLDIDLDERLARIHQTLEKGGSGKASMLQDVEARRKTEIERINGAVVEAADEAGLGVPLNRAMVALIAGLERSWGS